MDDGTRFTAAICTAALRQALKDFNAEAPRHEATVLPVVAGKFEYQVSDQTALTIVDVLKQGTDIQGENNTELPFNAYFEDNCPFIRLQSPEASGYIIVRYTTPHTVSGLDGASDSTLPANFDSILLDGACYRAAYARAAGRVEEINLNQDVTKLWLSIAEEYKAAFEVGLIIAARQGMPSQPRISGWNDAFHDPQDDLPGSSLNLYPRTA